MNVPVSAFHLISLKGAVKLEKLGMKRSRSPSAKTIAIKEFGLAPKATHDEVIQTLEQKIKEIQNGHVE
jgi:hypothetical protein